MLSMAAEGPLVPQLQKAARGLIYAGRETYALAFTRKLKLLKLYLTLPARQPAEPAPEAGLFRLRIGLQVAHEILRAGPPGKGLGEGPHPLAVALQGVEAGLARNAQLAGQMKIRGCDEGVDTLALRRCERPCRLFDVLRPAAGQCGDDRPPHFARDLRDGVGVRLRGDREAGFENVDAERV